jgi:hypothetical protein
MLLDGVDELALRDIADDGNGAIAQRVVSLAGTRQRVVIDEF